MIYMDNAATTRLSEAVKAAMLEVLGECFGNPSSQHAAGRAAAARLCRAREQVAGALNADPSEIFFTSGGTEADNWAIKGTAYALTPRGKHLITSQIEHHAVLHPFEELARQGFDVTYLPVDEQGFVRPDDLEAALTDRTTLVSIMTANNEVGSIQPIQALSRLAHAAGALFHTDAVQAAGCLPIDLMHSEIDLLSLSAHKFHGPKGIGALYLRNGTPIQPLIGGGAQEKGLRAGTENLPGIVGLGEAIACAHREQAQRAAFVSELRNRLEQGLLSLPGAHRNGPTENRLPGILNMRFDGVSAASLLMRLDLHQVAVSAGSACMAGSTDPSHVLLAMGLPREQALESIRFSLSDDNTAAEVDAVVSLLRTLLHAL